MLTKRRLIVFHFYFAIIALALGCYDFMQSQENFMITARITGLEIVFAACVWSLCLLPNSELKFRVPPFGIQAFAILIFWTLVVMFIYPNDEISMFQKITRIMMHSLFLLVMIGSYRWYSFNQIGKRDVIAMLALYAIILYGYFCVVMYALSNLIVEHLNTSYYILFTLPLTMIARSWKIKGPCIAIAFIAVLTSMKRGGTVALLLGLIVYFFVYLRVRSYNMVKAFIILLVTLVVFGTAAFMMGNSKNEGEKKSLIERFESIQTDGGSSRDYVYPTTWNLIVSQDDIGLLIGNGYNAVLKESPIHYSAHNDFMEITYDYGLIGFFLYLTFTLSFLRLTIRCYKKKSELAPMICFQFTNFIVLSNISHIFIYMSLPLVTLTYGIGMGQMRYLRQKEETEDATNE